MSTNTVHSILIEQNVVVFAHEVSEFWAWHLSGTGIPYCDVIIDYEK